MSDDELANNPTNKTSELRAVVEPTRVGAEGLTVPLAAERPPPHIQQPRQLPYKRRVGVAGSAYFQEPGSEPQTCPLRFGRMVKTEEGSYLRPNWRISEEWQPLDTGWLEEKVSLVVISNHETRFSRVPTEEQRNVADSKILLIGIKTADATTDTAPIPFARIQPGEVQPLLPHDVKQIYLRCMSGETRVNVTVFPG